RPLRPLEFHRRNSQRSDLAATPLAVGAPSQRECSLRPGAASDFLRGRFVALLPVRTVFHATLSAPARIAETVPHPSSLRCYDASCFPASVAFALPAWIVPGQM